MKVKLILIAVFTVFVTVAFYFSAQNAEYSYSLEFQGMESLDIKYISVQGSNGTILFLADDMEFDPIGGLEIMTFSAEETGYVDVSVHTQGGETYSVLEMPYKSGKTNYIVKSGNKLAYVKAHW